MSFLRYLRDNIRFIALYFVIAAFLAAMSLLDEQAGMTRGNAAYTAVVTFVLFAACVWLDYSIRRKQAKRLQQMLDSPDKTPVLPPPADFKDEQYAAIIDGLYDKCTDDVRRLEEDFRESKEFMAAWAHEAKTPVTAARLILESGLEEGAAESLSEEIGRINAYVEEALFHSRSDSFTKDYVIAEEDVAALVRENVKKHSALFIKKRIRVSLDIPEKLYIYTDRKWLLFIMDQLLSNALKYTPENGEIKISARRDERETVLAYSDNGRGIKKEDIGRIFDKSFTGANGREPGSSATGLGLYLARKLARKLGHFLTLSSEYGVGTVAEIHFPTLEDLADLTKM